MITSRRIDDLHPKVAAKCAEFLAKCREEGLEIQLTCTYRDYEAQNALYQQGRSEGSKQKGEAVVTNASGGESFHNWRLAFDVVPLRNGKAVWGDTGADLALWQRVGALGSSVGLEWGGGWTTFKDLPHFQYTNGLTIKDLQEGKQPN